MCRVWLSLKGCESVVTTCVAFCRSGRCIRLIFKTVQRAGVYGPEIACTQALFSFVIPADCFRTGNIPEEPWFIILNSCSVDLFGASNIVDIPPFELLIRAIHRPILKLTSVQLEDEIFRLLPLQPLLTSRVVSRLLYRCRRNSESKDCMLFGYR